MNDLEPDTRNAMPAIPGPDAPRPALAAGEMVSCYRIVGPLGRGGMGCVYKAIDTRLGRSVALKTLLPDAAARSDARARFLREARALAAVANDHVVPVHDVGEDAGRPFLVMEYVRGESLGARAARGRLSVFQILEVGREIAHGLAAAHAVGVVHRDLKPENILLDGRRGRAVLIDFGLAGAVADGGRDAPVASGSAFYMPPEQLLGQSVDGRGDLFALGVVLFRLLTGRLPFGGDVAEWRQRLLSDAPADRADALAPAVPPVVADLLARLLNKSVAGRPASAVEVEEELRDLLAAQPTVTDESAGLTGVPTLLDAPPVTVSSPTALGTPTVPHPLPAKGRAWKLVGAFAVVAGIATGGVLLWPAIPSPDPDPNPLPNPQPPATVQHPDGRAMSGWRGVDGKVKAWSFTGEVLAGKADGPEQVLLTRDDHEDFTLEFEFRWLGKGGHTGILFRAKDEGPPKDDPTKPSRVTCLMLDIVDDDHYEAFHGRKLGRHERSGGLFLFPKPEKVPNNPIGEWNRVKLVTAGPRVTVDWNGVRTFDESLADSAHAAKVLPALARPKGAIGLVASGTAAIEFRRFFIVELKAE